MILKYYDIFIRHDKHFGAIDEALIKAKFFYSFMLLSIIYKRVEINDSSTEIEVVDFPPPLLCPWIFKMSIFGAHVNIFFILYHLLKAVGFECVLSSPILINFSFYLLQFLKVLLLNSSHYLVEIAFFLFWILGYRIGNNITA